MNNFISFENSKNTFDYFFSKNHFLLLLISLVVIIFFSMYASRQKHKFQKIFVFCIGFLILIIEGLRIFWRYKYLEFNNEAINFFTLTNLDFFTIALWISIPLILLGSILKKKKMHKVFGLNFVFSIAMLTAIITLFYPEGLNSNFDFYHCYNLMFVLLRSFIIMLSLFFVFAKWISVCEFLDLWKSIVSLIFFGVICIAIAYFYGQDLNLFYIKYCPIFESLGIYLSFPWHLLVLGAFLFVFQIIIYLPFSIHRKIKYKNK